MKGRVPPVAAPARPELLGLLQAAREHPGDASRRLVLADWLEERGDGADLARAELIRIQCRLEPDLLSPDGPLPFMMPALDAERTALLRRQDQLLTRYEVAWLGPLRELALPWSFRRGMVSLEVAAGVPLRRAQRLAGTEEWAWVEGLELRGVASRQLGRLSWPQPASLTSLRFAQDIGHSQMRALLRLPWFEDLRQLDLAQAHVTEEALTLLADAGPPALEHLCLCRSYVTRRAAERLARCPVLDALTALDLRHNRLGDGAVEVLAANPRAVRLTHLLLAGNCIGPRGCRALARSPVLHRLTHLDLSRNPLGPLGAEALATAALDGLVHLDVGLSQLGPEGARALLHSPRLRRLERLRLDQNEIGDLAFLGEVPLPGRLRLLSLAGNPPGEIGLVTLALSPPPRQLSSLSLADCGVTAGALDALARSGWLAGLADLDLTGNALGRACLQGLTRSLTPGSLGLAACELDLAGVEVLAEARNLGRLACLHLADNQVGPEGARALARSTGLAGLVALDLSGNPVGDEAAVALVDAPALRQLSLLGLGDCDITDEGVAALARAPGLARISRLALGGPDLGPASARALLDSPYAGSLRVLSLQAAVPDPRLRQALQRRFGCCPTCWPSRGGPQRAGRA